MPTARTKANRKYNEKTYERLYPFVKKGKKEYYQQAVKNGGYSSLNDFIEQTLDEKSKQVLGYEFEAVPTKE